MSRPMVASAAKVKRSASVPYDGNALRELLARRLLDRRLHLRLHQAGGALRDQRLEVDAVDEVERVDDVALRLRHLLAVLVADQAGDVDLAERHVAHELEAHHDHPGDPEEDDVEAGDQHDGRVERLRAPASAPASRASRTATAPSENQVSSTSSSWRSATASAVLSRWLRPARRPRCARRRRCRRRRTTPGCGGPTRAGG